jgi:acetone carboxylase gamma subunit
MTVTPSKKTRIILHIINKNVSLYCNQKITRMSKDFTFTYLAVYQSVTDFSDKRVLVFTDSFSNVFEKASFLCPDGYFILEIKLA